MRARVIVIILALTMTPSLGQWKPSSPFTGRGDNTCESTSRYFAGLKDPTRVATAELQLSQWVAGYLSAVNAQRAAAKQQFLDIWSSQTFGWSDFFADYCRRNPTKFVGDGMNELIAQLRVLR
ncbi:MAG: hypothetical protein ACRECO_06890 [Xanthobacteraceae bacterium]